MIRKNLLPPDSSDDNPRRSSSLSCHHWQRYGPSCLFYPTMRVPHSIHDNPLWLGNCAQMTIGGGYHLYVEMWGNHGWLFLKGKDGNHSIYVHIYIYLMVFIMLEHMICSIWLCQNYHSFNPQIFFRKVTTCWSGKEMMLLFTLLVSMGLLRFLIPAESTCGSLPVEFIDSSLKVLPNSSSAAHFCLWFYDRNPNIYQLEKVSNLSFLKHLGTTKDDWFQNNM